MIDPFKNLPRLFIKAVTPLASLFLMLTGIMQLRAQLWTMGAICIILAMAGFILSMRMLEKAPFTSEEIDAVRPWIAPAIIWMVIISLLAVSVFYAADHFKSAETDRIAAAVWVLSLILGMATVWNKEPQSGTGIAILEKIKAHRTELIIVLSLFLLALGMRTIDLSMHPYPWSGDEASIGSEAGRILSGEITNFFETSWSSQPSWSFLPTAITEFIFGRNILAVRMVSAIAGTLAVIFVYLAAREFFNPTIALMAGAFLATLPYHVHFSRIGVANVMDSLVSSLMFWLIGRGLRKDDPRYYYSAGAVAGLSIYTYAGTRLVLILAFVTFVFLIFRQKEYLSLHWKHLFSFVGGTAISAAPQAAFFARHPDIFMGRIGQEGIFLNGWLAAQVAQTGKSALEILFSQFTRTTMVFIASSAPGNFFNSPEPYLSVLASILFLLGMGYALAYFLEVRYFILIVWFWAVILFGGILTLNPPANTRLLMTAPVVTLFMALGTYKILEYLQKFKLAPQRIFMPASLIVVAIVAYQNIDFYMFEYRSNMYFQDANGELAMEVGMMADELGDDFQIFILGEPRIFSGFPTLAFLAPNNPRTDLGAVNIETFELDSSQNVAFFAIPENRAWITEITQKYPGGEGGLVLRKPKPEEVLFEYYILSH